MGGSLQPKSKFLAVLNHSHSKMRLPCSNSRFPWAERDLDGISIGWKLPMVAAEGIIRFDQPETGGGNRLHKKAARRSWGDAPAGGLFYRWGRTGGIQGRREIVSHCPGISDGTGKPVV